MPQKFCPFAFFSFYVNKHSAEAGGCHNCVENACALWDEHYQQCSIKSAVESIGTIADNISNNPITAPRQSQSVKEVTSGVSSIFSKLRNKKKLPSAEVEAPATETPAVEAPAVPVEIKKVVTDQANQQTTKIELDEIFSAKPSVETIPPPPPPPPPASSKPVSTSKPEVRPAHELASSLPIAPKLAPAITPPIISTKPATKLIETPSKIAENLAKPTSNEDVENTLDDDFSDLLNPPPIDVSKLPIISKSDEEE